MDKEPVTIYWKNIQFDVVLPENLVWSFAVAFGKRFPNNDISNPNTTRPIDGYYFQGRGCHVKVSVHVSVECAFYDFLKSFCEGHGISVRTEDLKPGHPN